MLDWFATQRFAHQNGPLEGERRLCMFAGPGTPASASEDPDEEASTSEVRELREKQIVEADLARVRSNIFEMMEHEPGKAESLLKKTAEVQKFMSDVYDIPSLEFLLPSGELTSMRRQVTGENKKMLDETLNYLQPKIDEIARMRSIAETLTQWERGELQLEEFKNTITHLIPGPDPFDDITQDQIDAWKSGNPEGRMRLREEINKKLEIPQVLDYMMAQVDQLKKINEHVKGELLGAMPKQEIISHRTAALIRSALDTTFKEWNAESPTLEELHSEAVYLYRVAGVPSRNERLDEIEKAIERTAALAGDDEKKKKIRDRIAEDVKHVKNFLQRKLSQWSQPKLDAIQAWEHGLLPNDKFVELMKEVYMAQGVMPSRKLAAIRAFASTHGTTWSGNASDRIEAQEALKRAIDLRGTCKWLKRWAQTTNQVAPTPTTQPPSTPANTPPAPPTQPPSTPANTPPAPPTQPPSTPANTPPAPPRAPASSPGDANPPSNPGTQNDNGDESASDEGQEATRDASADVPPVEIAAHHGGFFRQYGIEFYSINDMIGGFKRVVEAYKQGFRERTTLKETAFASAIGKAIPGWTYLSGEVKLSVEKAADNEKDKETREFKEYLEERYVTFEEIFEGHGDVSMKRLQAEPTKARAVLEYAASRGWLYDIVDSKNAGQRTILGYDFDKLCSDWGDDERKKSNYFVKLLGQNASGQENEISSGKKAEHYTDKPELFIKAIDGSMNDLNFWEAIGIAQRAVDRGLAGEISPWIATTVMRHLTENEKARKYVNREVIDQFGLICLGHTARTLANLKYNRREITLWSKDSSALGKVELAGSFGKKIQMIQNVIFEKAKHRFDKNDDEKKKLSRLTAQVMAAQVVEVAPGKYVSVFEEPLLTKYADDIKNQGESNINSEDPDYYRNISDVILASPDVFFRIFKPDGSGYFSQPEKAPNLIEQLLILKKELHEKMPAHVEANYLKHMNRKLKFWFQGVMKEGRSGPMASVKLPESDPKKSCIVALFDAGFLGDEEFEFAKELMLSEKSKERLYYTLIADAMAKDPSSKYHQKALDAVRQMNTPTSPRP